MPSNDQRPFKLNYTTCSASSTPNSMNRSFLIAERTAAYPRCVFRQSRKAQNSAISSPGWMPDHLTHRPYGAPTRRRGSTATAQASDAADEFFLTAAYRRCLRNMSPHNSVRRRHEALWAIADYESLGIDGIDRSPLCPSTFSICRRAFRSARRAIRRSLKVANSRRPAKVRKTRVTSSDSCASRIKCCPVGARVPLSQFFALRSLAPVQRITVLVAL